MESIFSPDGLANVGKIYRAKFKLTEDFCVPRLGDGQVANPAVEKVSPTDEPDKPVEGPVKCCSYHASGGDAILSCVDDKAIEEARATITFAIDPYELRRDAHLLASEDYRARARRVAARRLLGFCEGNDRRYK